MAGTLYLVSTPIGNLEDITLRALRILGEVDLIACEDTRRSRKLLSHYRIAKPLVSCNDTNERWMTGKLVSKLEAGLNIALVSDAGTPLISDPGFTLTRAAIARQIPIVAVPGPSALIAALVSSGLPVNQFIFAGFLPARRAARRTRLAELAKTTSTVILYEAPHRIMQALEDACDVLGADRPAVVAREMTKVHEELIRGTLAVVTEAMAHIPARGEFVLLIGPAKEDRAPVVDTGIAEEVLKLVQDDRIGRNEAIRRVARSHGISRSEAYRLFEVSKKESEEKESEQLADDGADERT